MKSPSASTLSVSLFALLALSFVGLAIIGAIRVYSPVPLSDMWDGNVDFFRRVSDGDMSAWWAAHNEHRIVLPRILFWMDFALFSGTARFLIVANYLLAGVSVWVVWRLLRASLPDPAQTALRRCIGLFVAAWLFFWSQEENLRWGFQSQFILAQLLPLAAFYALYRSTQGGRSSARAFATSVVLGIASIGTMANGVLTLPLMAVYVAVTRQGRARLVLLAVLSIVLTWLYHRGLPSTSEGSAFHVCRKDPVACFGFLLLYLGGPFYYVARNIAFEQARDIAAIFGGLMIVGATWLALRECPQPMPRPLPLALLAFILYIGGTAAGTTLGRAATGEVYALSSRYTTPTVMAWSVILLLFAPAIAAGGRRGHAALLGALAALLLVAVPEQWKATLSHREALFQESVAVVALGVGVHDDEQIRTVYPFPDRVMSIADMAARRRLSVFSMSPYREVRGILGSTQPAVPTQACAGSIDETSQATADARFVRLRGWISDRKTTRGPRPVLFVDGDKVVGYGVTGQEREDVAAAVGEGGRYSGFVGYLLDGHRHASLAVVADACRLAATPRPMTYTHEPSTPTQAGASVSVADMLPGNQWLGSDFDRSTFPGMQVYGSLIRSSAEKGSVSFRLRRGATLFYRSGPSPGHQLIRIDNGRVAAGILPLAEEHWIRLRFDDSGLPDEFVVTLIDDGSGWGEWSAVAVSSSP
jgi:hypothetical protein